MRTFIYLLIVWVIGAGLSYSTTLTTQPSAVEIELPGMTIIGAELVKPTHNIDEVVVYVTWYDSQTELNRIYQRLCNDVISNCVNSVLGFSHVDPEVKVCEIHALKPVTVDEERMLVLGHELSHCLFGAFHQ